MVNMDGIILAKQINGIGFNGADSLDIGTVSVKDAGKKYYVGYDGAMQTGVFWISTYDEDKKEYVSKQIYADGSGIINEQQGWKRILLEICIM